MSDSRILERVGRVEGKVEKLFGGLAVIAFFGVFASYIFFSYISEASENRESFIRMEETLKSIESRLQKIEK